MKMIIILFMLILLLTAFSHYPVFADPVPIDLNELHTGSVTWGHDKTRQPISDRLSPGGSLSFKWTNGVKPKPNGDGKIVFTYANYDPFDIANDSDETIILRMFPPNDPDIKDWEQKITYKKQDGTTIISFVSSGHIKKDSPWTFAPLSDLPNISYFIPDLAAVEADGITIYEAVDLLQYMISNPLGPLDGNYAIGDTLDDLGLEIINGQIPGIKGLYFSVSPFGFDPNSATGYVPGGGASTLLNSSDFQEEHGALGIIGIHQTTPEPSTLLLFGIAAGGILFKTRKRGRHTGAG